MKRTIIALLICVLLAAAPFIAVSADTCDSYIHMEGTECSPGQTVKLTFAADASSVSGLSAEITVSDNLTLVDAAGMLSGWDFEMANNTVVMYDIEGETPVSGSTEFFELTVKVNGDSAIGDEISANINAKLATVDNGYETIDTSTQFTAVLVECRHYETVWQVVTPPSGGNAGIRAEVCVICGATLGQEEFSFTLGDVDMNGTVNIADAILIAQYSTGLKEYTSEHVERGDVDGNGELAILDAILIARYSSGIIDKFPIQK